MSCFILMSVSLGWACRQHFVLDIEVGDTRYGVPTAFHVSFLMSVSRGRAFQMHFMFHLDVGVAR